MTRSVIVYASRTLNDTQVYILLSFFNVVINSIPIMYDPIVWRYDEIDTYIKVTILGILTFHCFIMYLSYEDDMSVFILIQTTIVVFTFAIDIFYYDKEFNIYKFRSMTYNSVQESKTVQAVKHDPRVTRVGRILRMTSIDEIPQLFNVLNGTMSIVGPRPHAIDHNEEFSNKIRGYFSRHRVKPGLTGLAQVKGFRGLTDTVEKMENRVKYDIEYADNWSLLLDLKIILRTPLAVLAATNAH